MKGFITITIVLFRFAEVTPLKKTDAYEDKEICDSLKHAVEMRIAQIVALQPFKDFIGLAPFTIDDEDRKTNANITLRNPELRFNGIKADKIQNSRTPTEISLLIKLNVRDAVLQGNFEINGLANGVKLNQEGTFKSVSHAASEIMVSKFNYDTKSIVMTDYDVTNNIPIPQTKLAGLKVDSDTHNIIAKLFSQQLFKYALHRNEEVKKTFPFTLSTINKWIEDKTLQQVIKEIKDYIVI